MAIGGHGHRGTPVVSLVAEAFSPGSARAMTRHQSLVAKSVLVRQRTVNCATKKLAQSVRDCISIRQSSLQKYLQICIHVKVWGKSNQITP